MRPEVPVLPAHPALSGNPSRIKPSPAKRSRRVNQKFECRTSCKERLSIVEGVWGRRLMRNNRIIIGQAALWIFCAESYRNIITLPRSRYSQEGVDICSNITKLKYKFPGVITWRFCSGGLSDLLKTIMRPLPIISPRESLKRRQKLSDLSSRLSRLVASTV